MYIIDHDKQIAHIREMKQLRRNSKKYEVYYHHPYTNQMWKSFFPQAEGDELGPKLLRHEPAPANIEEQLRICLKEDAPENAVGLGIEWSAKPELWPVIIKTLEKRYAHYNRKQLKLFLDNLNFDEIRVDLNEVKEQEKSYITADLVDDLVWRSRKIRLKRFFVLG
jgi:hypothetical protein